MIFFKLNKFKFFSLIFLTLVFSNLKAENFQIAQTEYFINGNTQQKHLEHKVQINYKRLFNSQEELDNYILFLKQQYINLRIFNDVQINYFISNITETTNNTSDEQTNLPENHTTKVFLQIKTIDSKNFIALPYYKYDAKDGNVIKAKLRNSNFNGTLNTLETGFSFGLKQQKNNSNLAFTLGGDFLYSLPFYFGPIEASWNNDLQLKYTIADNTPEWKISTGFTLKYPLEYLSFILDFKQKLVNDFDYKIYNDQLYFSEQIDFSVPIKICSINNFYDIIYTPSINYIYNWKIDDKINYHDDDLLSPEILFSNKISTNNIYWNNNFKKGFSIFVKQDAGYNFLIDKYVIGFESEFLGFLSNNKIGLNTRIYGFYYQNKNIKIAKKIRGIQDDEYFINNHSLFDINYSSTQSALVINLDFPIHLFTTDFENCNFPKLKKINFEVICSPFIDIALSKNRATNRTFALQDGFYTAGVEFIVFPLQWKSIQVRASAGLDIGRLIFSDFIDTSWRANCSIYEFSFGIGLFY